LNILKEEREAIATETEIIEGIPIKIEIMIETEIVIEIMTGTEMTKTVTETEIETVIVNVIAIVIVTVIEIVTVGPDMVEAVIVLLTTLNSEYLSLDYLLVVLGKTSKIILDKLVKYVSQMFEEETEMGENMELLNLNIWMI
jgi:hypothetical protein